MTTTRTTRKPPQPLSGSYIRLVKPQKHHTCTKPRIHTLTPTRRGYAWEMLAGPGSIWRCNCGKLWEIGHDPTYTISTYWQPARWTTRWKYRGIR